jgi:hypothetical protein
MLLKLKKNNSINKKNTLIKKEYKYHLQKKLTTKY